MKEVEDLDAQRQKAVTARDALNQELLQVKMQLSTLTKTREEPTREESS